MHKMGQGGLRVPVCEMGRDELRVCYMGQEELGKILTK